MALSKVQFEREVNSTLRKFADGLKASEDYHDAGIQLCEKVRKFLVEQEVSRGHVSFSIAGTYYGGSIGKHTDVQTPDFDIVMKINNRRPPFTDVLNFWERVLRRGTSALQIRPETILLTPFSIQFTFTNGMPVDLLPASAELTEDQVYMLIKKDIKNRRYYSSSLVEKQVEFMKVQSPFAHAVARLAKYWKKSMDFGGKYVGGGSTIFEILAVAAVIEETRAFPSGPESMLGAFTRVVKYVEELDQLKMSFQFERTYNGFTWKVVTAGVYGQRGPYLMEPSNQYNNLLQGKGILWKERAVMETFKKNGRIMRQRINGLQNFCKRADVSAGVVIDFDKLFEPV